MDATLTRDPFMPQAPRVRGRAITLAVVAHVLLVLALAFGVNWRSDEPATVAPSGNTATQFGQSSAGSAWAMRAGSPPTGAERSRVVARSPRCVQVAESTVPSSTGVARPA